MLLGREHLNEVLHGVVYVDERPVPGAADTVAWLAREGVPYCFLTNTTSRPRRAIVEKLDNSSGRVAS